MHPQPDVPDVFQDAVLINGRIRRSGKPHQHEPRPRSGIKRFEREFPRRHAAKRIASERVRHSGKGRIQRDSVRSGKLRRHHGNKDKSRRRSVRKADNSGEFRIAGFRAVPERSSRIRTSKRQNKKRKRKDSPQKTARFLYSVLHFLQIYIQKWQMTKKESSRYPWTTGFRTSPDFPPSAGAP